MVNHKIRKVIYTTSAIELLNRSMRKILKTRRAFPNDEAATKLNVSRPYRTSPSGGHGQ